MGIVLVVLGGVGTNNPVKNSKEIVSVVVFVEIEAAIPSSRTILPPLNIRNRLEVTILLKGVFSGNRTGN